MALIRTHQLYRDFGGDPILKDIDLALEPEHRYGLVGRNGCGKTTMVRILAGLDEDYRGNLQRLGGIRVALVEQKAPVFEDGERVVDFLTRDIFVMTQSLDKLAARMADPDRRVCRQAMDEYSQLRERFDSLDGDHADENARRLLDRIGLGGQADNLAETLSGGEKNLLSLARALLLRPDLLILDEPGNHLDVGGLAWLEEFLAGLPCCLLLVSHDRRLLDRVVTDILELENGCLTVYKGNYSQYRLEKLRAAAAQGRNWQADRRRVERLEALVQRFAEIARSRPDPAWGKRLRARRSQLARVKAEATERPDVGNLEAKVVFDSDKSKADLALAVQAYAKAFGSVPIIENSNFTILNGERVALVGSNGSGKTSFLRDLVATGSWDNACLKLGPSMVLGYCAQQQEVFNPADSVETAFLRILATKHEVLQHLNRFLFDYNDLSKIIGTLSGGELNRLQLARASALRANFLVLDEPTNHLDIPTREAVEEALADFDGSLLVVSHDRYFLDKVAERVIFIQDKRFVEYEGSFAEYWRDIGLAAVRQARSGELRERTRAIGGASRLPATKKQAKALPDNKLADIEARITQMESQKAVLERRIAEAVNSRDFGKAAELSGELERHNRLLDQLWQRL